MSIRIIGFILLFAFIMLVGLSQCMVRAQEGHPPEHQALHEQFYSKWNMPEPRDTMNLRIRSCCDKKDCYPTAIRRVNDTTHEARRRMVDKTEYNSEWVKFPSTLLEQNQEDEKESPDGQSHACISPAADLVYCATLGSGT